MRQQINTRGEDSRTVHIPHKCVPNLVVVYIELETNRNQLFGSVGVLRIEFAWPA